MLNLILFLSLIVPKWHVGDCVQYDKDLEPWEKPSGIYKIEEVGKNHYRTSYYNNTTKKYEDSFTTSFYELNDYSKVKCPK